MLLLISCWCKPNKKTSYTKNDYSWIFNGTYDFSCLGEQYQINVWGVGLNQIANYILGVFRALNGPYPFDYGTLALKFDGYQMAQILMKWNINWFMINSSNVWESVYELRMSVTFLKLATACVALANLCTPTVSKNEMQKHFIYVVFIAYDTIIIIQIHCRWIWVVQIIWWGHVWSIRY